MKKIASVLAGVAMFVGSDSAVSAGTAERAKAKRTLSQARTVAGTRSPDVVGTVTYDTGLNAGFPPDTGAIVVGNRFNSALGGPLLMTGAVTMATIFPQNSGNNSFTFFGPPNSAGVATQIGAIQVANLMAGVFSAVTLPTPIPVGPDFLGAFYGIFGGTPGLVGLDSNSTLGQGFHAFQATTMLPQITMFAPIAARNAMYRVTGDLLTPVELMNFELQ